MATDLKVFYFHDCDVTVTRLSLGRERGVGYQITHTSKTSSGAGYFTVSTDELRELAEFLAKHAHRDPV